MADAAADIEERGVSQTAKDLFSGAAGGIAQVLIGESKNLSCPCFIYLYLLMFAFRTLKSEEWDFSDYHLFIRVQQEMFMNRI